MNVIHCARSGGIIGISNTNTQYTIFNIERKITLNDPKSAAIIFIPTDSTAMVNEPLVFRPLKVYCMSLMSVLFVIRKKKSLKQQRKKMNSEIIFILRGGGRVVRRCWINF